MSVSFADDHYIPHNWLVYHCASKHLVSSSHERADCSAGAFVLLSSCTSVRPRPVSLECHQVMVKRSAPPFHVGAGDEDSIFKNDANHFCVLCPDRCSIPQLDACFIIIVDKCGEDVKLSPIFGAMKTTSRPPSTTVRTQQVGAVGSLSLHERTNDEDDDDAH